MFSVHAPFNTKTEFEEDYCAKIDTSIPHLPQAILPCMKEKRPCLKVEPNFLNQYIQVNEKEASLGIHILVRDQPRFFASIVATIAAQQKVY